MLKDKKAARKGLRIIIVGGGKIGSTLVEQLSKEGHDITLIDIRADKVQEISGLYDVMGIVGNGASYSVQMEAGISQTDLIIAVTGYDELNLLCCTVAKRVGNCAAIARVRNPDYNKEVGYLREKLELAMIINPELEMAKEASHILSLPTALEVNSFAHGQAELIKVRIPEGNSLCNKTIMEVPSLGNNQVLICAVERGGEVYIPSGHFKLSAGDLISFTASRKHIREFLQAINLETGRVKTAMIIGGGKAAYYLASQLLHSGVDVKIIERDRTRCEELSVTLPKATIINGDGSDQELLIEEGIQYVEAFVPLTGIDEENILLTLYAKEVSHAKVITKINRIGFHDVISSLDLGSVIYPKYISAEAIIAYVRARSNSTGMNNIETLYHLFDHRVEAIEFLVNEESPVTDIPLKDLPLKKNLLISFINRNGNIIIPSGNDTIKCGDTVMIVTTQSGLHVIRDILD